MTRHPVPLAIIVAIATLVAPAPTPGLEAQVGEAGQVHLGVYTSYTRFGGSSLGLDSEQGWGARVGFAANDRWWAEAWGDFTRTRQADRSRIRVTHLGGTAYRTFNRRGPNLFLGIGLENVSYRSADAFVDAGVHLAAGTRVSLGGRAAIRVQGRAAFYPAGARRAPGRQAANLSANVGVSIFAFGGPVRDSDGDAVRETVDRCPETPPGATVDPAGCPSDSDSDGIMDGIDNCADTPQGALADPSGCPLDTDGDSVLDGLDDCPGTPMGAISDTTGCPSDGDADGIFDGIDRCVDTAAGDEVDGTGCPAVQFKPEIIIPDRAVSCSDTAIPTDSVCVVRASQRSVSQGCLVGGESSGTGLDCGAPVSDSLIMVHATPSCLIDASHPQCVIVRQAPMATAQPTEPPPADTVTTATPADERVSRDTAVTAETTPPATRTDSEEVSVPRATLEKPMARPPSAPRCSVRRGAEDLDRPCSSAFAPGASAGDVLVIRGIVGTGNGTSIPAHARSLLDGLADAMRRTPALRIEVTAHSDATGAVRQNLRMSLITADIVKNYLVRRGIDADRIVAVGFGPDRPLTTNLTAQGRALNRRIEVRRLDR